MGPYLVLSQRTPAVLRRLSTPIVACGSHLTAQAESSSTVTPICGEKVKLIIDCGSQAELEDWAGRLDEAGAEMSSACVTPTTSS